MDFIIILVIVVLIVLAAALLMKKRRSDQLKTKFGPEYSRAVEESGDPRRAEAQLLDREKRVKKFTIRPLLAADQERFESSWRRVQAEFVDDPKGSISHADALLGEVMSARGYPVTDFEQRSADLSVDHPSVVQQYRAAHDIAVRHSRGEAGTEDLRQAMIHCRALFDELVHERANDKSAKRERSHEPGR